MAVSTATTDWHCSACSVSCSSKVSDLISSGRGSWRCPVDMDGGGGVHSRETSGRYHYREGRDQSIKIPEQLRGRTRIMDTICPMPLSSHATCHFSGANGLVPFRLQAIRLRAITPTGIVSPTVSLNCVRTCRVRACYSSCTACVIVSTRGHMDGTCLCKPPEVVLGSKDDHLVDSNTVFSE